MSYDWNKTPIVREAGEAEGAFLREHYPEDTIEELLPRAVELSVETLRSIRDCFAVLAHPGCEVWSR